MQEETAEAPGWARVLGWVSLACSVPTVVIPLLSVGLVSLWGSSVFAAEQNPWQAAVPVLAAVSFVTVIAGLCAAITTLIGLVCAIPPLTFPSSRKLGLFAAFANVAPWVFGVLSAVAGYLLLLIVGLVM